MRRPRVLITLPLVAATWIAAGAGLAAARPAAKAATAYHECQHPVMTGVEVYDLHHVTVTQACPVALKLFRFEQTPSNTRRLYGCRRARKNAAGRPYLKRHSFDGYSLHLGSAFRMSRGDASFSVAGTDFPVNCS